MNYVAQMNAFWSWRLLNQLNSRAADLYMALLHFNNLGGWQKEFTVSSTMLQSVCGISRTELSRHRNTLIQMGLISYQGGKGSRSGFYQIFDLCIVYRTQTVTQPVTQTVTQPVTQLVTQPRADKKVYINNIINNKQNEKKQEAPACEREEYFARFWEAYPVKVKKAIAQIEWNKLVDPCVELYENIIAAVEQYKQTSRWKENNGAYIPYPETFLQDRRWEDEIRVTEQKKEWAW
ncbi:hypothetical protein [Phascolarctobacterium sp.]